MSPEAFTQLLMSAVGVLLSGLAVRVSNDLARLTKSVEELNSKMAGVSVSVNSHEKRLDRLEDVHGLN